MTNLPTSPRGWRANPAYIDATHRVHARVEDGIRTGKGCGIGRFPSHDFAINSGWLAAALIAATLLAWLRLLALEGDPARAESQNPALQDLARHRPADPQRPTAPAEIFRTWPWATAIVTSWTHLNAPSQAS